MANVVDKLIMYFQYPFVRYALIVGVLIALCSSLLGVTLVLKRLSLIGDGLSHIAFAAMAIAGVLSVTSEMILVLPITIVFSIILLCAGQNSKIKGDAAVAMLSVGAIAIGYLIIDIFLQSTNSAGDVCSVLFGSASILTLSKSDVILSVILSIIVILTFIIFYNKIFAVVFDESFSKTLGINVKGYNFLIAVIVAIIIVLAMKLVGALLISALIVFPALSAMRVFKNFKAVTICSAILSIICSALGILVAMLSDTSVGSTIVATNIVVFFVFWIIGILGGRR